MKKTDIKLLLQGSRPGEPGVNPEHLREALEHLSRDEELQRWYELDQAFDQAFLEKIQQIEPPPGLREAILNRDPPRATLPIPRLAAPDLRFWKLAAAALVIFFIGFSMPWILRQPSSPSAEDGTRPLVPDYIAHLSSELLNRPKPLTHRGASFDQMKVHLASANVSARAPASLELENWEAVGCLVLEWRKTQIGMLCFRHGETVFHLLYADLDKYEKLFPEIPREDLPLSFRVDDSAFRVWVDEFHINILTHEGNYQDLEQFF